MCLYTRYVLNPRYKPNKKNKGKPPICTDKRLLYVPIKCGKCMECRKQKQREWVIRLSEEIRSNPKGYFITLTINDESFKELKTCESESENDTATKAIRLFLERIRKKTNKSVKHWCITELGEKNGRIHLHGLFWCNPSLITECWQYGYVFIGRFVNERTIFYITKYMLKVNEHDKNFVGKILTSKGIGSGYTKRLDAKNNRYKENGKTKEQYRLRNGTILNLPQYYRNKIYSENEKAALWIEKQERGYRYIMGEKVMIDDEQTYNNILQYYQRMGINLYGDDPEEWDAQIQRERLRKMKLNRERYRLKNKKN